jgi:hypothetical protein
MHLHDHDAFGGREPVAKRIHRVPKHPIGIHERWSGDGHDKLYKIGFPIWAMVDDATGKWLGAWVVPSNRMGEIVAYLFLCLIEEFEGMFMVCVYVYIILLVACTRTRYASSVYNGLWFRDHKAFWVCQCPSVSANSFELP